MSGPEYGELRVRFTARQAGWMLVGLLSINLLLTLAYVGHVMVRGVQVNVVYLIDLEAEANLPTWFSTIQLFLIGAVFLTAAGSTEPGHLPTALFLALVGAGFVFLSADEAARIHEGFTVLLRGVPWLPRAKGDHMVSVPVYVVIVAVLALLGRRDFQETWRRFRRPSVLILIGAAALMIGAVGAEFVRFEFWLDKPKSVIYHAQIVVEESLEMAGASVMLYGALLLVVQRASQRRGGDSVLARPSDG